MGKDYLLVRSHLESAFSHTPVSPVDSPLLGCYWESPYYAEPFLPFGLRTAPYLFHFFAEVFNWILEAELHALGLTGSSIHYLDEFLLLLSTQSSPSQYTRFPKVLVTPQVYVGAPWHEGCIASHDFRP